jgi:hypothetical protein
LTIGEPPLDKEDQPDHGDISRVEPQSTGDIARSSKLGREGAFLSHRDEQYVRALSTIGYRQEATSLLQRAYERRSREINGRHGSTDPADGVPLFTDHDIQYLETLLSIGRRSKAVEAAIRFIDEYENAQRNPNEDPTESLSGIEKEYVETIKAIETGGPLPPDKPSVLPPCPPSPSASPLRQTFDSLFRHG